MAIKKIILNKTPEQLAQEEAEFYRQREAEAQERNQEQERHLRMLVAKNKRNKIIVIAVTILLILALLIFGTYNTFIKHTLNNDDVLGLVNQSVVIFPDSGLHGFIYENFESWYSQIVSYKNDDSGRKIDSVKPILNTLVILETKTISRTLIRVNFAVDIETKYADTKNDLGLTVPGETVIARSTFFIPIECNYLRNANGQAIASGYAAASKLSYYMLESADDANIHENSVFAFNGNEVDSETKKAAEIKVDKILKDLYDGADTSQDYEVPRKFVNENNDIYSGLTSFAMYQEANQLGYNCLISYKVTTTTGFSYINTIYLAVFQNGSTWYIGGWM